MNIVKFIKLTLLILDRDRVGPYHFATTNEKNRLNGFSRVPFAGVEEWMLGQAFAGKQSRLSCGVLNSAYSRMRRKNIGVRRSVGPDNQVRRQHQANTDRSE